MRKQVYAVTIGVLLVLSVFSVLQFWQIKPVEATTLFSNDIEEGQFNPSPGVWTSNSTDGTSTVAVTTTTVYAGTYAANLTTIGNQHPCILEKTLSATGDLFYGFEFQVDSLPPSSDNFLEIGVTGASFSSSAQIRLYNNGSAVIWQLLIRDDTATSYLVNSTKSPSINTWYWVELYTHPVSSNGGANLYVDDVQVISSMVYDADTNLTPTNIYLVGQSNGATHKCLFDSVVASTTYVNMPGSSGSYPTFSVQSPNSTTAGEVCLFSCLVSDDIAVNASIFGTNNTGTWVNETAVSISGTSAWVNVTKTLNSTVGVMVQFRWWANDTSNNWGSSSIQSLTIDSGTYYLTINSLLVAVTYMINGTISGAFVTASSGSPTDIQTAVDTIEDAGGGTVYIPAGNWTFNPPAGGVGVTVPQGVNLIGVGKNETILRETVESIDSTMIYVDGFGSLPWWIDTPTIPSRQKPVRIQGMSLLGFVPSRADADSVTHNNGLIINCIKDFVVYDCLFSNFVNIGLGAWNSMGWETSAYIMRGVVSHCDFDDPYKDDLAVLNRIWGYGIIVGGSGYFDGTAPLLTLIGHYDDVSNVVYIEDCNFTRCRHAIASSGGSYYVARHNYFTEMIQFHYGSYIDAHGTSVGVEIYDNVIENSAVDYRTSLDPSYIGQYLGLGIGMRGGGGVIFNNTINNCPDDIRLYSDLPDDPIQKVHDFWIWNNTFTGVKASGVNAWSGVVLNQDYFLREPNVSQDGFTYTSYVYPHPLVIISSPEMTNGTVSLAEGTYSISVPPQVTNGTYTYDFVQWQDASTNATIIIALSANTTITATYTDVSTVSVTIGLPTNTTYDSPTIVVSFTASGGTIDKKWFNVKNGTVWVYASNQSYPYFELLTDFVNGTSYTGYFWANNTEGTIGVATVMFSVSIPLETAMIVIVNVWWSSWW